MRILALSILLVAVAIGAEEQRPLDPGKPADALVIIHALTLDVSMPRKHADAFRQALETLARAIEPAPAKPAEPAPTAPAKGEP